MTNKKEKRKKIIDEPKKEVPAEDKFEMTNKIEEDIQNEASDKPLDESSSEIFEKSSDKSELSDESSKKPSKEIFIYAEICQNKNHQYPHPVVYELINAAKKLSDDIYNISVLYLEQNLDNETAESFFKEGADKIYHIKNDRPNNPECPAAALIEIIKKKDPDIIFIGATSNGRLIAPIVSSTLKTGLTADCTKLDIIDFKDEKKLAATRPTFGGQLMATILCKTRPQMVTVRPGVLPKENIFHKKEGEIEEYIPDLSYVKDRIKLIDSEENAATEIDLETARIVVSGGAGLKNREGFDKLRTFAKLIGASVAGSRRAVDMKLIEKDFQIGQTGKTIAPEIYMAFGISGAIHHISGMQNSTTVIAINTDPDAAIFSHADYGIIKDAIQVLDALIEAYKK